MSLQNGRLKNNLLRIVLVLAFLIALAVVVFALNFNDSDKDEDVISSETAASVKNDLSSTVKLTDKAEEQEETQGTSEENPAGEEQSSQTVKQETTSQRVTESTAASTSVTAQSAESRTAAEKKTTSTTKANMTRYSSGGGIPEAAAYAYAGFNPVVTDMSGDWKLMLINKHYCLPAGYKPDLSPCISGSDYELDSRVSPHYQDMFNAAAKDGIYLTPVSGYRSVNRQKINFENKINYYMNQGYGKTEATKKASMIIFLPGASEHNAGLAMDIISLDTDFDQTRAFRWLCDNAADYGFILRYPKNKTNITECTYEPWHWRYVGVKAAKEMKASGQVLEEYLGKVS